MQFGYGILLFAGLMAGVAVGLFLGQPSAGAVVGIGAGAVLGLVFAIRRPRG
ncbi:hypothetical protein [Thermaurantiacus sp.]